MRFVRIKSAEQQGQLMQHRTRDVLIRQRTQRVGGGAGNAVARKLERYCSRWRRTELLGVTQLCLRARIIQFQLRFGGSPRG